MSKSKCRKLEKQREISIKRKKEINEGKLIAVEYEERKKKHAIPNRLNGANTAAEELAQRQDTAEKATAAYRQMLPELLLNLNKIKDPRKPERVKHKMTVVMAYGILLFVFHTGSRRNANKTLSCPIFFENLNTMFPELKTLPHADTLARLLERIDAEEIQASMILLIKELIRKKKFQNYLIRKRYLIAVDGTQKFYRDYKWDEHCLKRKVGGDDIKTEQFYVYVLESVLILDNGITLPLMSIFVKNEGYIEGTTKQDCEQKAFKRLAKKLKQEFPKTRISLVMDGLYACGPIIQICKKNDWDFMIVLKEDSLKEVWREAIGLMRLDPENSLKVFWGEHTQEYSWANDIEYEYGENGRYKQILNVVICYENWTVNHINSSKKVEEMNTRYAWISSKKIHEKNVFSRCTKMGRFRWCIENNILTEKHQGYEYEHCYSYSWNAMEGFHYLMKIGRLLNVLAVNSTALVEKVRTLGIRGFISHFKLACSGCLLNLGRIATVVANKSSWRLVS